MLVYIILFQSNVIFSTQTSEVQLGVSLTLAIYILYFFWTNIGVLVMITVCSNAIQGHSFVQDCPVTSFSNGFFISAKSRNIKS